jgi:hypothetical protein
MYIFLSSPCNFSKIYHILGHKRSFTKYKKIKILPYILSNHNAIKLELNNKNNSRKYAINWRQNNTLQVISESYKKQTGNQKFPEFNENENTTYQDLWDTAKTVLRGKFIPMSAYMKMTERSQINDLMLHLKLQKNKNKQNPIQAEEDK